MKDVVYILVVVAFFALAALFVRACNTIVGAEAEEAVNDERR
jgi:predicted small secreted protein